MKEKGSNFDPSNLQENLRPNRKSYFAHNVMFMKTKETITIFPVSGGEMLDGITFTPEHMRRFIDIASKKLEDFE